MSLPFADLRLVLSASDCAQHGGWSYNELNCDPWGRPFNYPSLWVKIFSVLGIVEKRTMLIGAIQIILLVIVVFWWVKFTLEATTTSRQSFLLIVVALIFLISPPFLLLMERGNVDIWIFFGLSVASVLFSRGNYYAPIAIISFLGALKIYPFASFLLILKSKMNFRRIIFFLLTICLAGFTLLGDWHFVLSRSITTWNSISYGSSVVPLILFQIFDFAGSKLQAAVMGWMIFLCTASTIRLVFGRQVIVFGNLVSENLRIVFYSTGLGRHFSLLT